MSAAEPRHARPGEPEARSAAPHDGRHRDVWTLAWPIVLSNLSIPLVGAVDTAVVGHLGEASYIGAVALGAMVFSVLYWGFGFLRMGTTGFIAQSAGAGDRQALAATLVRSCALALVLGGSLIALSHPVHDVALHLLDGSEQVEALASEYILIRIWSAPAALLNYVVMGFLIGVGRTRLALALQLLLNLGNLVLDLLLVSIAGYGVAGVAMASLIAEILAATAGAFLLLRYLARVAPRLDLAMLVERRGFAALLGANLNIMLRTLGVIAASFWFLAKSARAGDEILAVNAVLLHLRQFASFGLDGVAHAIESLTGRAYGAGRIAEFRFFTRSAVLWSTLVAVSYCVVFAVTGPWLIDLLTGIASVRGAAREFLPWLVLLPIVATWSYLLDGIYIGCTRSSEMRNGMWLALAVFVVALELLIPLLGNHGLWAGLMVFLIARAIPLWAWLPRIHAAIRSRARATA
jgi:MATE family multidrug resistance protein